RRIVNRGRESNLHLMLHNSEQPFRPMAHELFDDMAPFAAMLDTAYGGTRHSSAMQLLRQRIDDPDLTPAAQVLEAARAHGGFFKYTMHASSHHKQSLLAQPLDTATQEQFEAVARESLQAQREIEEHDSGSFEDFVAAYYA
ncbi:MAG: hypothetical protein ABIR55_06445, partial [Burkholderiaceae bacterium]